MCKFLPILLFTYGLSLTTDEVYDNSYALLIGIDKYQNAQSLDYAVKDAEDIRSLLIDKFNFQEDNIVLLKNELATKTTIIQEFSNITKMAGGNDRVLIFFAGHGMTIDLPDGGEMGYLMPVNGDAEDLYVGAIDMDELRKLSLLSKAKHILYLVDACYGGVATIGARNIDNYMMWSENDYETKQDYFQGTTRSNILKKITREKSRQIISAGGRGEEVIEKAAWGHSAFTKNLLSGLKDSKADIDRDGIITAHELGAYLKEKVTIDSGNQQTPQSRRFTSHEGEFIFVLENNKLINQSAASFNQTSSFKLIIIKYDSLFMNPFHFPPIIANNTSTMIASAPKFIINEPNFMDENTTSEQLKDWEKLINNLSEFEKSAALGDSLTTFWDREYYFKVYAQ